MKASFQFPSSYSAKRRLGPLAASSDDIALQGAGGGKNGKKAKRHSPNLVNDTAATPIYYYKLLTKHALPTPLTYAASIKTLRYKRVMVSVRNQRVVGFVLALCPADDESIYDLHKRKVTIKSIEGVIDDEELLNGEDVALCEWIMRYYAALPSEAYSLFVSLAETWLKKSAPPTAAANADKLTSPSKLTTLAKLAHITLTKHQDVAKQQALTLSTEQHHVYQSISKNFTGFQVFLIKGVTGSGKSYLYVKFMLDIIARGQIALILVPEISLVFQLYKLCLNYCSQEQLAVFHSKLSQKERQETYLALRRKKVGIVIGTRSALFIPKLAPLGLIILDEEHENAYKNSSAPRYHARQIAYKLAQLRAIPLIFGSATPSLETYHAATHPVNASQGTTLIAYYTLNQRYGGIQLPTITFNQHRPLPKRQAAFQRTPPEKASLAAPVLANGGTLATTKAPSIAAEEGQKKLQLNAANAANAANAPLTLFSQQVLQRMQTILVEQGQILVYINRRGFSSTPLCTHCGYYPACPNCSVALTFHKRARALRCHYCGYSEVFRRRCVACQREDFFYPRYGTEQVLELLRQTFPTAAIARFDSDELTTARKLQQCLKKFASGELAILVGTQMLAKGHDFPGVRLMVMLYPERTLLLPDFRSYERVYRELVQASGRAGRVKRQGEVFVETTYANDPLFRLVKEGRLDDFYATELSKRKHNFYPPFSKLVRLVVRGEKKTDVATAAAKVKQIVLTYLKSSIAERQTVLIGPTPCLLEKLQRNYRYHLTIKTVAIKAIFPLLKLVRQGGRTNKQVFIEIDIDPVDLF